MSIFIIWLACVVMGVLIGGAREKALAGFLLGFFIGPIGVCITLCLPNDVKARERARDLSLQQRQLEELRHLRQRLDGVESVAAASEPVDAFLPENLRPVRHRPVDLHPKRQ